MAGEKSKFRVQNLTLHHFLTLSSSLFFLACLLPFDDQTVLSNNFDLNLLFFWNWSGKRLCNVCRAYHELISHLILILFTDSLYYKISSKLGIYCEATYFENSNPETYVR